MPGKTSDIVVKTSVVILLIENCLRSTKISILNKMDYCCNCFFALTTDLPAFLNWDADYGYLVFESYSAMAGLTEPLWSWWMSHKAPLSLSDYVSFLILP